MHRSDFQTFADHQANNTLYPLRGLLMNAFNKFLVSSVMAVFLAAPSFTASAVANPSYEDVKAAIENTLAKVEETIAALDNGTDNEVLIDMVSDARQLQKDIANNRLDLKRNQASGVLKKARNELKNNELATAKETLTDAANRYKEIQQLYASTH
jgi:Skp family chaperone for outer membrane proteins